MTKSLSDAIDEFLLYRRNTYSKATALASGQTLGKFLALTGNIPMRNLSVQHAERFQAKLLAKGQKPNTVNSRMNQLRAFSKWAVTHRYIPTSFVGTVRALPVQEKSRMRVHVNDFPRLLDAADRPDRRVLIALGLYLFLRGGEINTLRVGDVDLDNNTIDVMVHKTRGFHEMPVSGELHAELVRWFAEYEKDIGRPLRATDYLIPAHVPVGPREVPRETGRYNPEKRQLLPYQHVQRTLEKAGYPVRDLDGKLLGEGVHTLRRSGARALFDALVEGRVGGPAARDDALRLVMTMLHHSSIQITEHYLGLEADRIKLDKAIRGQWMFTPKPLHPVEAIGGGANGGVSPFQVSQVPPAMSGPFRPFPYPLKGSS